VWRGKQAFEDALHGPAQADFHLRDAQQVHRAVAQPFQIDIVDANHFAAVDVDDLAVDQVLLQEEVVFVAIERVQRGGGAQFKRPGGRLHHLVRGHNLQALARLQHQARHAASVGAGGHGNIFEPAADVALRVGHRGAEHGGQADAGCRAGAHGKLSIARTGWRWRTATIEQRGRERDDYDPSCKRSPNG
jgi:hypothetical protein